MTNIGEFRDAFGYVNITVLELSYYECDSHIKINGIKGLIKLCNKLTNTEKTMASNNGNWHLCANKKFSTILADIVRW